MLECWNAGTKGLRPRVRFFARRLLFARCYAMTQWLVYEAASTVQKCSPPSPVQHSPAETRGHAIPPVLRAFPRLPSRRSLPSPHAIAPQVQQHSRREPNRPRCSPDLQLPRSAVCHLPSQHTVPRRSRSVSHSLTSAGRRPLQYPNRWPPAPLQSGAIGLRQSPAPVGSASAVAARSRRFVVQVLATLVETRGPIPFSEDC